MLFIVPRNVLKANKKNRLYLLNILIVTENKNKNKKNTKQNLKSSRLQRLEKQLKANILKRKIAKKNNG